MQNSKNPPSVSDSVTSEFTEIDNLAETINGNGRTNGGVPIQSETSEYIAPTSDDVYPVKRNGNGKRDIRIDDMPELGVDPVAEPAFLEALNTQAKASQNGSGTKSSALEIQQPFSGEVPNPEDSTVIEPEIRPRSLRMQLRFWRTIIFAGWLFARLLFWQVYAVRYVPGYVKRTEISRFRKYAREFRNFAINLGGVHIKLGQFISTRVDILPEEIIKELESLQDEVPTIKFSRIREVVEAELGSLNERYAWFNEEPIAAASLGQVHRAQLHNGDRVVVKVQRPGIRTVCFTDLAAMRVVARIAMRFRFISNRADAKALVEEFGHVLLEELSYKHEAYNAYRFADIFKNNMGVYIPSVYNEHSTDSILTIEDVTSIKISDYEAMEQAGISRQAVAKRLMDTYLPQVFHHYFFHADPHPGNMFVYPLPVENENADFGPDGRPFYLIFVDFGMTGTLTREIADGMVTTLWAVLTRNARRLVEGYVELGFILPGADIPRIIEAAEAAFDEVWGMSMTEMRDLDFDRVAHLADDFSDLIFSMPFYIPQDFIYLGRTISILSGMCTSLDPNYNPWKDLEPYTEILISRGFGKEIPQGALVQRGGLGTAMVQSLFSGNGREVLVQVMSEATRRAFGPISRVDTTIQRINSGDIQVIAKMDGGLRQQLKRLERESRSTSRSIFFGSILITATLFYINGDPIIAGVGYMICLTTFVLGILRG